MKQIGCVVGILLISLVSGAAGAEDESGLEDVLRQVVENNLAAYNREDAAVTMQTVHTKSPEYTRMQQALPDQYSALDTRTELVSLYYMGHDDEFAVARVKLKTVDQSGKPFVANILDTITVFHQEDGVWKYWSSHVLGIEPLQ